jgi:23S rRNA (uridine2552-2'-O)-methyltransferase
MKRSKKKRGTWQDHYSRKAKKENFPARSVYKLQEVQKKFRIIKKGDSVLDLGCSPGSWLLFAADLVGPKGFAAGLDLKEIKVPVPDYVTVVAGDVFDEGFESLKSLGKKFNVVLSDMAPSTTGHKETDSYRSFELCRTALGIARELLAPGGNFVCKIFQGAEFKEFSEEVKNTFKTTKIFKPQSSRKGSKEIYVIGMGKKQEV